MTGMIKRGRPRNPDIATDVQLCQHHNAWCEHRQWRRGLHKSGEIRYVWICTRWQNESNKAAYARRAEGAS